MITAIVPLRIADDVTIHASVTGYRNGGWVLTHCDVTPDHDMARLSPQARLIWLQHHMRDNVDLADAVYQALNLTLENSL